MLNPLTVQTQHPEIGIHPRFVKLNNEKKSQDPETLLHCVMYHRNNIWLHRLEIEFNKKLYLKSYKFSKL